MKTVILDTNFLLIPAQFKVDIFEEIERIMTTKYKIKIIDKTIGELKNIIEKQSLKHKSAARIALQLVKKYKMPEIKTDLSANVDRLIIETVNKESFIVATQDKELKRHLKSKKIPLIILRKKQFLELIP